MHPSTCSLESRQLAELLTSCLIKLIRLTNKLNATPLRYMHNPLLCVNLNCTEACLQFIPHEHNGLYPLRSYQRIYEDLDIKFQHFLTLKILERTNYTA